MLSIDVSSVLLSFITERCDKYTTPSSFYNKKYVFLEKVTHNDGAILTWDYPVNRTTFEPKEI